MKISEHANYLLNEYGRLQFDYAAYCKPDGESLRNEARNNLETYIAELEAAQRWIPVSERLPEVYRDEDGDFIPFLVCEGDGGYPFVAMYDGINWRAGIFVPDITHWMPLPELPEESKKW